MSTKALVAVMVALLVLVGVALVLSGRGSATPAAPPEAPLAGFDPALVSAISVKHPDEPEQRIVRHTDGRWALTSSPVEWPVAIPASASTALAALADTMRDSETPPRPAGSTLTTITVSLADRTTIEFLAGRESLGGRSRVWSGAASAMVVSSTVEALSSPGPRAWRIRAALPGASDASRVSLATAQGEEIALARLAGRWTMRRPISARAEPGAVDALLRALSAVPVERFEDSPAASAADMGLLRPVLVVRTETDHRSVDAAGSTTVRSLGRTLRIGGPASARGDLLYASADDEHRVVFTVPAAAISSISTTARNYLSPTVTGVRPEDVFLLTVSPRHTLPGAAERSFRRDLDRWAALSPDATRTPTESAPIEELLRFLSETPGEPDPIADSDVLRPVAVISLFDIQGDTLDVISVGYNADGMLGFRSGNLVVFFAPGRVPGLLSAPPFADLPPQEGAAPPPTLPQDAPTGK